MCDVKVEEVHENLAKKNEKNISSLHILLIIILLTVDYASMFSYSIDLKSFKYIVNYQELLVINSSIIVIFSLLSIITKKIPILFAGVLTPLFAYIYFEFDQIKGLFDSSVQAFAQAFIVAIVLSITLYGPSKLYKYLISFIKSFGIWVLGFVTVIVSFIIALIIFLHYDSLNSNWNKVYIKNNEYQFSKYTVWQSLFRQKTFSTNRLEQLQNNIKFVHSNHYINELQQKKLLNNNIFINDTKRFYSNYILNGDFKTFFIVRKIPEKIRLINGGKNESKATDMYIVFTKKDLLKEEYQIINILKKDITVKNLE